MQDENRLAAEFEQARPHLRSVALRLLGSVAEADDAVQDAWLRASGKDPTAIENPRGWLTTIVSRICLDRLKAWRRQRSDPWPEDGSDAALSATPEETQLLDESVGLAMLVVLERLSPLERVAFVLHDALALPFEDIAAVVDRSVAATKKLASRARQRVYGATAPSVDMVDQSRVVDAFLAAARDGDVKSLVALLAPDVVRRVDSVARDEGTASELRGADAVAKEIEANRARAAFARALFVDGVPGAVVAPLARLRLVLRFTFAAGRIATFEVLGSRQSLDALELRLPPPPPR